PEPDASRHAGRGVTGGLPRMIVGRAGPLDASLCVATSGATPKIAARFVGAAPVIGSARSCLRAGPPSLAVKWVVQGFIRASGYAARRLRRTHGITAAAPRDPNARTKTPAPSAPSPALAGEGWGG